MNRYLTKDKYKMLRIAKCQQIKTRERDTDRHHEKSPLVTRLSIQANNSARRVSDYSVEKPNMIN